MIARSQVLLLALLYAFQAGWVVGDDQAPQPKKTQQEVEKEAKTFAGEYRSGWQSNYSSKAKLYAQDVAKFCECSSEVTALIVKDFQDISARRVAMWEKLYQDYYVAHHEEFDEDRSNLWDHYGELSTSEYFLKTSREITQLWLAALKKHLTPEQFSKWNTEAERRYQELKKVTPELIEKSLTECTERQQKKFESDAATLAKTLGWPTEREKEFKPAIDKAVEAYKAIAHPEIKKMMLLQELEVEYPRLRKAYLDDLLEKKRWGSFTDIQSALAAAQKTFQTESERLIPDADRDRMKKAEQDIENRLAAAAKDMAERTSFVDEDEAPTTPAGWVSQLNQTIPLGAKREEQLRTEAKAAWDKIEKQWRADYLNYAKTQLARTLKSRKTDPDDFFKEVSNGRWHYTSSDLKNKALNQWEQVRTELLSKVFSAEEMKNFKATEARRVEDKAAMLAHVVVAELDARLLLQPAQREKLEPLALKAVKDAASLPGGLESLQRWGYLSGMIMFVHGIGVNNVEAVLDGPQRELLKPLTSRYQSEWESLQTRLKNNPRAAPGP